MTPAIQAKVREYRARFLGSIGNALEVGSYDVNGGVRQFFSGVAYTGIDQAMGPGVDIAMNAHDIPARFGPASFDAVLCLEMLEHDPNPILTLANIRAVLRPRGYLVVSTPTSGFPEHRFPKDYWRLMPDTYRDIVFAGMELLDLSHVADGTWPGLIGIGRAP